MTMLPLVERIAPGTPAYRHMAFALLMAGFSPFGQFSDVQPLLLLIAHRLRTARPMRAWWYSVALARCRWLSFRPAFCPMGSGDCG